MIAKIILPVFGGGSAVWLTSIIFFQIMLLSGYYLSHLMAQKLSHRNMIYCQMAIVFASVFLLPLQVEANWIREVELYPALQIFALLFVSIGIPYLLLSTTSPTIQHWIASHKDLKDSNPYVHYAVSNAGSLLGLLIYPFLIEATMGSSWQTRLWSYGYFGFAGLIILCGLYHLQSQPQTEKPKTTAGTDITVNDKLYWIFQAAVPSAALITITQYITLDIASFPLLWIIPLSLYLISFIIVFLAPRLAAPYWIKDLISLSLIALLCVLPLSRSGSIMSIEALIAQTIIAGTVLLAIAVHFHGKLERSKPHPQHLTAFYLYLSLGGILGSLFAGTFSAIVFKSHFEFFIVLIISGYAIAYTLLQFTHVFFRNTLTVCAILTAGFFFFHQEMPWDPFVITKARSFYGTYMVHDNSAYSNNVEERILYMGSTYHGAHAKNEDGEAQKIAYYQDDTGIGMVLSKNESIKDIAVVGLGAGNLALFCDDERTFDFYEIDPLVAQIAVEHFDNLDTCPDRTEIIVGDGRLKLKEKKQNSYDLIVLDAFTSDAIPTHLLTVDATREYLETLRSDGLLLFHITNRHLDLSPVLTGIAETLNMHMAHHFSGNSHWVVMTYNKPLFDKIVHADKWKRPKARKLYWTDEFSNILSVVKTHSNRLDAENQK